MGSVKYSSGLDVGGRRMCKLIVHLKPTAWGKLKGICFQAVETQALSSTRGQADVVKLALPPFYLDLTRCHTPSSVCTIEAAPIFACNEPSVDNSINCKVIVVTDTGGRPVAITLYTITEVVPGQELTIFYGQDRHDTSYPRMEARWKTDDANGLKMLNDNVLTSEAA